MRQLGPLALLIVLFGCSHAPQSPRPLPDLTLSAHNRAVLAPYLQAAQKGDPSAHLYLAQLYCGKLCLEPTPHATQSEKRLLIKREKALHKLKVKTDYVVAYAHLLLSDDPIISHDILRRRVSGHLSDCEMEMAHSIAMRWKAGAEE